MARIQRPGLDEVPAEERALLEAEIAQYGTTLNSSAAYAHCPPIHAAAKQFATALNQSGHLPIQLRSLLNVRVASLIGCPY